MTIESSSSELAAGAWSVVGPDVEHGITAGAKPARILAIVLPRRRSPDAYTVVE